MQLLTNKVGKVSTPPLVEATEEGPERASMPQTECHHDMITTGDTESVGYGWMTTRAVDLPMSRKVGAQAEGALGAGTAAKPAQTKAWAATWTDQPTPLRGPSQPQQDHQRRATEAAPPCQRCSPERRT